jgi:VanZ family protein
MRIARLLQVVAWAGVIFTLSSFSNPPGATGDEWRSNLAHMTEYAILAALAWRWLASARPSWRPIVLAGVTWLACVAYGASDEYHQSFVPNRDSNVMDVGFDALGAGLALAAVTAKANVHNRRSRS